MQQAFVTNGLALAKKLTVKIEVGNVNQILSHTRAFEAKGENQSATFAYCQTFMEGADVFLRIIHTEMDADLELHLLSICETLPWLRASGRQ